MTSANHVEDLNLGRGWLNRAAEMLDACEDHRSDAEFARAAAAIGNGFIRLAAAEREAAAQAFVDERHAVERVEDLERIATNRTEDLERIAAADAKAWEHQDSEAEVRDAVVEAHRAMTARMRAEQAEVEQRAGVLAALDVAGLAAAGQREKRAEAEARPHDDKPVLGDVIKCQKCGKQTRSVSRGCSVCGLGKPSSPHGEAFPSWPGVVYVVEGEETGVLYGAYAKDRAEGWIETEGRESWGSSLAVTALEVDRG